mmetsp:Transcript_28547/g.51682  ORF Transcript_28547/g.51682 Transcript_28547/m.51682 type:complete len:787 (-) Transcript_28547:169-2529(-)
MVLRVAAALLLLSHRAGAEWISIGRKPGAGAGSEVDLQEPSSSHWVPLTGHRLRHPGGYHTDVIGNLRSVKRIPPLWAARNFALVAPLSAGTPAQHFQVELDASSGDIWIPSMRCATCAADRQELESFYNASASTTFKPQEETSALFGRSPRAITLVDSGGRVGGFIVNDTIEFAGVQVVNQPFILAEEGDLQARRQRAWDGVFGLGRKAPVTRGSSFHEELKKAGNPETYILAPVLGREGSAKAARLAIGVTPEVLSSVGPFFWVDLAVEGTGGKGSWSFKATAASPGLQQVTVKAVIETGTSFLLVPHHQYFSVVRGLIPSFDKYCGVDHKAGNVVICDCSVREQQLGEVTFEFLGLDGQHHGLAIRSEDLLEQVPADKTHWMAADSACILQVQQRPHSAVLDSPFGVLGKPFMGRGMKGGYHGPFPGATLDRPALPMLGGIPLGPGPVMLGPTSGSAFQTPGRLEKGSSPTSRLSSKDAASLNSVLSSVQKAMEETREEVNEEDKGKHGPDLMAALMKNLGKTAAGAGIAMKEEMNEYLGNGERCITEITRAANGSVTEKKSWLMDKDGSKKQFSAPECNKKEHDRRLEDSTSLRGSHRNLQFDEGADEGDADLWVLGDVFLRRHAVAFDFERSRIGFALHEVQGQYQADAELAAPQGILDQQQSASVEALSSDSMGTIQQFEADAEQAAESQKPEVWQMVDKAAQALQDHHNQEERRPVPSATPLLACAAFLMGLGALAAVLGPCRRSRSPNLSSNLASNQGQDADAGVDLTRGGIDDDAAE